ncbi:chaperonin-containing T-complex theta subunit Cct8 [Coemansia reversa NRRL 1564]|uniref:CCT-theta n=1 Tax=Coemansia reversa (strain ATCC 12441 / NRRL 1564) TaxID=763665 RepID=A0A2G5B6W3_COERN|nr:chaperonin-containing T-complex theta subunit Cct8 [Coemansia reversa NRRL 1564]|eukprot:PIA14748.1 chaperonin-containing T-complex theta subunit Cct8 [Coemansia reversa NRRL 1564]
MALRVPQAAGPQLFKEGYKNLEGLEEVILRNIQATKEMSEITRTSFGPNGRNKMVVNHLDKLFVTSDAATIIRELEVVHPAARLMVMASQQQEAEAGDGTNYVVILGGELLQRAEPLLRMGLHPSEIARGYELALASALEGLETLSVDKVGSWADTDELLKAVRTAVAAKQYGQEELLAPLVAQAVAASMPKDHTRFNVDNVRVVKIMGGGLSQSRVVHGMVFPQAPVTARHRAECARVAVFSCPVDMGQTETKGTVLLHNASEMLEYTQGEESQMEQAVRELHDAGVGVIVCGSGVGELAIHFLNRFDIVAVRCSSKFDLRRLCRVVGANPLARFGVPTPEEMGYCDEVRTDEIGGDRVTIIRQWTAEELADGRAAKRPAFADRIQRSPLVTIVLRGATQNALDDAERAVDDGVNVVKALTKDARLVPGACAAEMELARIIHTTAERTPGINQHAVKAFATAMEVFARTLGDNVGVDSTALVAKLIAAHHAKAVPESGSLVGPAIGIDVNCEHEPRLLDAVAAGILDPLAVKLWAIRYATQAALTVLQVDQIVMAKTAGGPKLPKQQQAHWDED